MTNNKPFDASQWMMPAALHWLASIYSLLVVLGSCSNAFIVITTAKTKRLHNPCNILIALCALSDMFHQLGQIPKIVQVFVGKLGISSVACFVIQILPSVGLSAGTMLVLLIAIDRLLSVHLPSYYSTKNCHGLVIVPYLLLQYGIAYTYFEDRPVFCNPPEIYHGRAKELWGMSSLTIISISIVIYCAVWWELKNKAGLGNDRKLFRSIFSVMGMIIAGWLLTMGSFTLYFMLDPDGKWILIGSEVTGLPVNTTLALNCFVLYRTSHEYRKAFRRLFRALPLIKRFFPHTTILNLSCDTHTTGPI